MEEVITVYENGPGYALARYVVVAALEYMVWLSDPFQNPEDWQDQRDPGGESVDAGTPLSGLA